MTGITGVTFPPNEKGGGGPRGRRGNERQMVAHDPSARDYAGTSPEDWGGKESVLVLRLVEGLLLVARRLFLVLGLPFVVRHAVDDLARLGIGDLDTLFARLLAIPARQAIAAEAGQVHQVEVLHVGALLQVRDQAAEGGSFEFGAGFVVHGTLLGADIGSAPRRRNGRRNGGTDGRRQPPAPQTRLVRRAHPVLPNLQRATRQ